jgi:hypothetical protein
MHVRAFWGPRPCSIDDVVPLVIAFMDRLASLGPPFDALYYARDRPRDRLIPYDATPEAVRAALVRGRSFDDTGELMADLGSDLMLDQNLRQLHQARVWFSICGTSTKVPNSVRVSFGPDRVLDAALVTQLEAVLTWVIEMFRPDIADVGDDATLMALPHDHAHDLGWINYLSHGYTRGRPLPPLPASVVVTEQATGVLVRLGATPIDAAADDHRALLLEVDRRLHGARVLPRSG